MLGLLLPPMKALAVIAYLIGPSIQLARTPFPSAAGFSNPSFSKSSSGFANCVSGIIKVTTTTKSNEKIRFDVPADEFGVTETIVHFMQLNSSQPAKINGGLATVSGTFDIAATLCYPKRWSGSTSTIQFLTHGIGTDQFYWDFAEGYSFIDFAAEAGYPTFSYDRLGVGASAHPDPIQTVQASLQVEIAHTLATYLREGKIGGYVFKSVVGVGHSFGSVLCVGLLARYPKDFDAVVLTGFSMDSSGFELSVASFDTTIASRNQPARFGHLPDGYLTWNNAVGNQFAFFSYPNFDMAVFAQSSNNKQTYTYGEIFTLNSVIAPCPSFNGPVDAVIGEFDVVFAQGNATSLSNPAVLVQPSLFPGASNGSQTFIVPNSGHAINLHHSAPLMFDQVQRFVKANGF